MLEGINFSYDGYKSADMGLINCKIDDGMFEEVFMSKTEIHEIDVSGRDKPYFQGIKREPLEFELTFALVDGYDERKIREIARWLSPSYYKPFYTTDNPNRIFYCMMKGDSLLVHNGSKEGYITITMRCDSPYSYTPYYNKDKLNFRDSKAKVFELSEDNFDLNTGLEALGINFKNGNMEISTSSPKWSDYENMKWSDLVAED